MTPSSFTVEAVFLQELLFVFRLHVEKAGEQVDDPQRIIEGRDERLDVWREARRQRQRAVDELLQAPDPSIDLDRPFGFFRQRFDQRLQAAAVVLEEFRARPGDPFDEDAHAVLALRHLPDDRDGADAMKIVGSRVVGVVLLQQQQHHPVAGERAVDGFNRDRAAHAERRDGQRKHDRAAKRHDRKLGR